MCMSNVNQSIKIGWKISDISFSYAIAPWHKEHKTYLRAPSYEADVSSPKNKGHSAAGCFSLDHVNVVLRISEYCFSVHLVAPNDAMDTTIRRVSTGTKVFLAHIRSFPETLPTIPATDGPNNFLNPWFLTILDQAIHFVDQAFSNGFATCVKNSFSWQEN